MTILYALHWHNVKGNTLNNNNLSFLYKYAGKNNYNNLINNGYLQSGFHPLSDLS